MRSGKKTILIVEDDTLFLWSLDSFLQNQGYEVASVESGELAFDLVQSRPFDLVISDFQLPGVDGKMLIRKIKGLRPEVKTILISAYQPEEFGGDEALLLNAYLNKPIELGMLKKLVADLVAAA
jgi:CheY-like chemotaxis protein